MRIRIARRAAADIIRIREYIARDDPAAADRVVEAINASIDNLRDFPRLGRRDPETRALELRVAKLPYVVPYLFFEDSGEIVVLRIHHLAQDWRLSR